ncbi:MAG: autotransporter domain-containing protein [Salinarimonas sp.]|nr:autotransporter domain-containing protein [Salinarimonas sp.]
MGALVSRFRLTLVLALTLQPDHVVAINNVWTGAVSSDWHEPGNWSDGIPPDSGRPTFITTNTPHAPHLSGGIAGTNRFSIVGDGRLTIDGGADLLSTGPAYTHSPDASPDNPGVILSGAGTVWRVPEYLGIGRNHRAGAMIIKNGARLETNWFQVTPYDPVERSYLRVSGPGTTLVSDSGGEVGTYSQGIMIVADDAHVGAGEGNTLYLGDETWSHEATIVIGAVSGEAPVGPGRISAQRILAGGDAASIVFNHTGTDYVFDTPLEGDATILHQSGTTIITAGNAGFTGETDVTGGVLRVEGGLRGTLDIRGGARLSGTGIIGETRLHAGATVAPGNSIGTLSVDGDVTFAPGSRFEVTVDPASGAHDRLAATGRAIIDGGEVVHVGRAEMAGARYQPFASYRFLTADDGVEGRFDAVSSGFAFLDADLSYSGNAVDLVLSRNDRAFASVAATANQRAVAQALEGQDFAAPLHQAVLGLDAGEARTAFEALSGERHAPALANLAENTAAIRTILAKRFRLAFDGAMGAGADAGPATAYAGLSSLSDPGAGIRAEPRATLWAKGFGQHSRLRTGGGAQFASGVLLGADMPLERMPGDSAASHWRVGMLGGLGTTQSRAASGHDLTTRDLYLGVYAGRRQGEFNLNLGATGSRHAARSRRSVRFPGFAETLEAQFAGYGYQVFGEAGYRLHAGQLTVEPIFGLAHLGQVTQSFRESGGDAALAVNGMHHHDTRATLGTRLQTRLRMAGGEARVHMMAGWQRRLGGNAPQLRMRFAQGPGFAVAGTRGPADALVGEAGIDLDFDGGATLGLSLDGSANRQTQTLGGNLDLRVPF